MSKRLREKLIAELVRLHLKPQQCCGVTAKNARPVFFRNFHGANSGQHFLNAANLVRIVASGKNMVCSGESNGQLNRARIEVHRIEIEAFEVFAGWLCDVLAAVLKSLVSSIEPFCQIRNGAAQMSQHPADSGKALSHAAENQSCCRQRRIKKEAD